MNAVSIFLAVLAAIAYGVLSAFVTADYLSNRGGRRMLPLAVRVAGFPGMLVIAGIALLAAAVIDRRRHAAELVRRAQKMSASCAGAYRGVERRARPRHLIDA